jgi:presenilin-like A22 family membrane protease
MWTNNLPQLLADVLAVIFVIAAIIDVTGLPFISARFRQRRYSRQVYRVVGLLQLFTALFLVVPQLRIWGIIVASLIASFRIVIVLYYRQWSWVVTPTRSAPISIPPYRPARRVSSPP